jgi:hypothetical protein
VSRSADQRIVDILDAIERCRRYVGVRVDAVLTYDRRLAEAVREAGLDLFAPGQKT